MSIGRLNRIVLLQWLTLIVVLFPVFWAGYLVWDKHQYMSTQLAQIEPRYARLLGIVERRADYKALNLVIRERLSRVSYSATQDATKAGNEAQQRIRGVFADNQLDIASIQVMPPKQLGEFDKIEISLRVEGSIKNLHDALLKLAELSPVVLVDSLSLQTIGAARPASVQRLGAQLILTVFRSRS